MEKKSAIHTSVLCSGIGGAYYFNPGYLAVSYTHLDVYKRQGQKCVRNDADND